MTLNSFIFSFLCAFLSVNAFSKIIPIDSEKEFNRHPKLVKFLQSMPENDRAIAETIDPSFLPIAPNLVSAFATRMDSLLLPEEKNGDVYVMVSKSLQANAFFVDLENGDRLITTSLGLAYVMNDEDKLTAVFGHELEHGWSSVQEVANQAKSGWLRAFYQRAVENEVDIKSIFKRLIKIGASPYAMKGALRRLREHYGENLFSSTHTNLVSREDTTDIVVTAARRELGMPEITLDTESKLKGGMTEVLRDSRISSSDYEIMFLNDLISRLPGSAKKIAEKNLKDALSASREKPSHQRSASIPDIKTVILKLTGEFRSYFDEKMDPKNEEELERSVYKEIFNAYQELITANIQVGAPLHKRGELELRHFLNLTELPSRTRQIESFRQQLDEAKLKLEEEKEKLEKGDQTSDAEYKSAKNNFEELEQYLNNAIQHQALIDELSKDIKSTRQKILRNAIVKYKNFYDLQYLNELDPVADYNVIAFVVENISSNLNLREFKSDSYAANRWIILEKIDPKLLDQAFTRLCQKILEEQKYYGIDIGHKNYGLAMGALKVQTIEAQARLKSILQKELLTPLYKIAEETAVGSFKPTPHPDPNMNKGIKLGRSDINPIYTLKKITEYIDELNANLSFLAIEIPDQTKLKLDLNRLFLQITYQAYENFDARLKNIISLETYRDLFIHENLSKSFFHRKKLNHQDILEFLTLSEKITKIFPNSRSNTPEREITHNISEILSGNGYTNFFNILKYFGEENAKKDRESFFRLVYRIEQIDPMSFSRLASNPDHVIDLDTEMQTGYARWLMSQNVPIDWNHDVFYHWEGKAVGDSGKSPEEEELAKANREIFTKIDYSKLHQIKVEVLVRNGIAAIAEKRTLHEDDLLEEYFQHVPEEYVLEYPTLVLGPLGSDLSSLYLKTVKKLKWIQNRDYLLIATRIKKLIQEEKEIEKLLRYYETFEVVCNNSARVTENIDQDFEILWEFAGKFPREQAERLRHQLAKKSVVSAVKFRRNKFKIFDFRFQLDIQPQSIEKPKDIVSQREEVKNTIQLILELFPNPSGTRDRCIDFAGNTLITNPAETDALYELVVGENNAQHHSSLILLDMPSSASILFNSKSDKLTWLEFFTGKKTIDQMIKALPQASFIHDFNLRDSAAYGLANFRDADNLSRAYIILPLLDDLEGLLSDDVHRQKVKEFVLGKYSNNKIASAVYDSYFKKLPPGERRVILAGILATSIDQEPGKPGFLSHIVNGLKSLGVKSAQKFRTSGFGTPEVNKELDFVFDASNPVRRDKGLAAFRRAFGKDLKGVLYFGKNLGYGSVNHVWESIIQDPSGVVNETAMRFLRDYVADQARSENEVWMAAIEDLRQHSDPEVRLFANQIEQIRASIAPNLLPAGREVNFEIDKQLHAPASQTYAGRGENSGRETGLVPLLPNVQNMVAADMQSSALAMKFIHQTKLATHPERRELSADALRKELRGTFQGGKVDPDGHGANWLPEDHTHRLYRTDWSLYTELDEKEVAAGRDIVKAMLSPRTTHWGAQVLKDHLDFLFILKSDSDKAVAEKIIDETTTLEGSNPVDRIYFLRAKIEKSLHPTENIEILNLNPKFVMGVLHSIAKTRIHAEYTGERTYRKIFAEEIGLTDDDRLRILGSMIKHKLVQVCDIVKSTVGLKPKAQTKKSDSNQSP